MDVFATEAMKPEDRAVTISAAAAKRLHEIFDAEGRPDLMLRVTVSGGGCSGFSTVSILPKVKVPMFDLRADGIKVVIDDTSLDYLASEIDFVNEMVGSAFQVNNPNATSGCGCGASFR